MVDLRDADLAFTAEEAVELLAGHGVHLPADDLDLLMGKTEGWAAGLRLAALSLQRAPDPHRLLVHFSGDQRAVGDYLVEAVLSGLAPDVRSFLLQTSIAEELSAPLAVHLTDRPDAGAVLDALARTHALTTRVGGDDDVRYRYHTLLRGYLQAELRRLEGDGVRALHVRASRWHAEHGSAAAAIDHAVAAADRVHLAGLLDRFGLRLLLRGGAAGLHRVGDALRGFQAESVRAALLLAAIDLDSGDLAGAGARLDAVAAEAVQGDDALLRAALRLLTASALPDPPVAAAALAELEALPAIPGEGDIEVLALAARGGGRLARGDVEAAERDVLRALLLARRAGLDAVARLCLVHLIRVAAEDADLPRVRSLALEVLAVGGEDGGARVHCHIAHAAIAWAGYHMADPGGQGLHLQVAAAAPAGAPVDPAAAHAVDVLVALARHDAGDPRAGLDLLRRAWHDRPGAVDPLAHAAVALVELRIALALGELAWARTTIARTRELLEGWGEVAVLGAALAVHRGHVDVAREHLAPVIAGTTPCRLALGLVDALLLEAVVASTQGFDGRAHDCLRRAVEVAEPRQALRPFVSAGEPLRALLVREVGRSDLSQAFLQRALEALGDAAPTAAWGSALTPAEMAVLADLPAMMTLREIAQARHVSINTVKTHLRGIYQKLEVTNRRDAVLQARLRHLL